jgi:hypothetical protein
MKFSLRLLPLIFLAACTASDSDIGAQPVSREALIGEWRWEIIDRSKQYTESGWLTLKGDGRYSRVADICRQGSCFRDQVFANLTHGWYLADSYICFVEGWDQWKAGMELGYIRENCTWRALKVAGNGVQVENRWLKNPGDTGQVFILVRQR